MSDNLIDFKLKVSGHYSVKPVRYISVYGREDWYSSNWDTIYLQYVRFDSLEDCHQFCKMAKFTEYEIEYYKDANDDYSTHGNIVFTTPLLQQAKEYYDIQQDRYKKIKEEQRKTNQEFLKNEPKRQVIAKFSAGRFPYLVFTYSVQDSPKKDIVYTRFYLLAQENSVLSSSNDNSVDLWNFPNKYIAKGTKRILKKKLLDDFSRYGFPRNEIETLFPKLLDLAEKQFKFNNMVI